MIAHAIPAGGGSKPFFAGFQNYINDQASAASSRKCFILTCFKSCQFKHKSTFKPFKAKTSQCGIHAFLCSPRAHLKRPNTQQVIPMA